MLIIMTRAKSDYFWRFCAFCAALSVAAAPAAVLAGTIPGDAQVAVVTPLSLVKVEDLDFGRIIASPTASTVTISTANARTSTGGAILVGNDHQRAMFAGRGTRNQRVNIVLAPAAIPLLGPGLPMTVTNLTIGVDGTLNQSGASPNYRIVATDGIFWFHVGGRLNVGANQAAGRYSGTFTATVVYQ